LANGCFISRLLPNIFFSGFFKKILFSIKPFSIWVLLDKNLKTQNMKTNKLSMVILAIIVSGALAVTSCKKKEKEVIEEPDTDQSGSTANNTAENISGDLISMGSEGCDLQTSGGLTNYRGAGIDETSLLSCATVVPDTLNKTVTVTFNGGVCIDGKIRTGSLVYNYSGSTNGAKRYRHPGFKMTVTSNNYAVNGNTVSIINKSVENITASGFNPQSTNLTWSVSANISIALAGGGSISWNCNRVNTLLNTSSVYSNSTTPINWAQARVGITGSAAGLRSNGETFTANITNQLIRDRGACTGQTRHVFIQGTFVYTPGIRAARTFDYGNGACDLNATVTINGNTYSFAL